MKMRVMTVVDGKKKPTGEVSYWLWCPGCDDAHRINNKWEFDGNLESPTFNPSILVHSHKRHKKPDTFQCHSYVRDGQWQFLDDSTHPLAGQTVPMVDLPKWLSDD